MYAVLVIEYKWTFGKLVSVSFFYFTETTRKYRNQAILINKISWNSLRNLFTVLIA